MDFLGCDGMMESIMSCSLTTRDMAGVAASSISMATGNRSWAADVASCAPRERCSKPSISICSCPGIGVGKDHREPVSKRREKRDALLLLLKVNFILLVFLRVTLF